MDRIKGCRPITLRTLWPQEETNYHFPFGEPEVDLFRRLRTKTFAPYSPYEVYLVGYIGYDDIFNTPHMTFLCFKYFFLDGNSGLASCDKSIAVDY